MMGQNLSRQALELARCETKPKNETEENEKTSSPASLIQRA
jgi:hypothetical protein